MEPFWFISFLKNTNHKKRRERRNAKIAENPPKMPRGAILFPANFKIFVVCFVSKLLDIWPNVSFRTMQQYRDGHWTVIAVQYKTKATAAL
jgi:hypothetical protein